MSTLLWRHETERLGTVQVADTLVKRAGLVGLKGLEHKIPVLTPKYLLPSQWVLGLFTLYPAPKYGTKPRDHNIMALYKTYPLCYIPLSRSARHSFATSLKFCRHNMIFVAAQRLSGIGCGNIWATNHS